MKDILWWCGLILMFVCGNLLKEVCPVNTWRFWAIVLSCFVGTCAMNVDYAYFWKEIRDEGKK
jgi:hypothetical protein